MNDEVVSVRAALGRNWVWPSADVHGWNGAMWQWPELEMAITEEFPSGGAVGLQCGGCCGMYPWRLLNHFQRVLTFEPDPLNFHCLSANVASPRVVMFQAALGDACGTGRLKPNWKANCGNWHVDWDGQSAACHPEENPGSDIVILTIDTLRLPILDGLFLDAEGSEERIIIGAQETLERCRPRLITLETVTEEMIATLGRLNYVHSPKQQPDVDHVFRLAR